MPSPTVNLTPLTSLTIHDIVDGEVDAITPALPPPVPAKVAGGMPEIARRGLLSAAESEVRGGARVEMRMDKICCGAHGLGLLVTASNDQTSHSMLFDAGPEGDIFERNALRLGADLAGVERVQLSHWHRDHSGGLVTAVRMICEARAQAGKDAPVVDLHPDRPEYRGLDFGGPVSMEADPRFEEFEGVGAVVERNGEAHGALDGFFVVSGEIPMVTSFEKGLARGIRFEGREKRWVKDEEIRDERFLMCWLKDKGLVVFTGCSHRGVVNAAKCAVELAGGSIPLYAIVGGYHLADGSEDKVRDTVTALKELDVKILLAGHCTGWKAKFELQRQMPGRFMPAFVGTSVTL